jgi:hypothetical protein
MNETTDLGYDLVSDLRKKCEEVPMHLLAAAEL